MTVTNLSAEFASRDCISCGACVEACPEGLSPQFLHQSIRKFDWKMIASLALASCSECALCEPVCPSRIALVSDFRYAKAELAWQEGRRNRANAARARFNARNIRLAAEQAERRQTLAKRSNALDKNARPLPDAIASALARAKLKLSSDA